MREVLDSWRERCSCLPDFLQPGRPHPRGRVARDPWQDDGFILSLLHLDLQHLPNLLYYKTKYVLQLYVIEV